MQVFFVVISALYFIIAPIIFIIGLVELCTKGDAGKKKSGKKKIVGVIAAFFLLAFIQAIASLLAQLTAG